MALLGKTEYDGLITGNIPTLMVGAAVIRKLAEGAEAVTYTRGTILAKSSTDAKLVILGTEAAEGEELEPYCILCDDTILTADDDVTTTAYMSGCFNQEKTAVNSGYILTEKDLDTLRKYGIVFKNAAAA